MYDHAAGWSRLLTDGLEDELAEGTARGLPIDPALHASTHIYFGVELMLRVAEIDRSAVVSYLHHLADALGRLDERVPLMVTLEQAVH